MCPQVRRVFFTPEFQAKHDALVELLSAATTWPGGRWTRAAAPTRAKLVLTTHSAWRKNDPDIAVTTKVLLDIIAVIDLEATSGTM